jgi:hypothetical protein
MTQTVIEQDKLNPFDLEQECKRARSLIKTPEGREALRRTLGYNFLFEADADLDQRPIVSVLVPTRDAPKNQTNKAFEELIVYSKTRAIIVPQPGISSSVVHWARNDLLARLRKAGHRHEFVLLMDDDMVPPPDALVKMIDHDKDIVAGACTVRTDPPLPNFRVYDEKARTYHTAFEWGGEGLIEVGGVGAAFMLVKRHVFDAIGEYTMAQTYPRKYLGMSAEVADRLEAGCRKRAADTFDQGWFEFLKQPDGDGEFGEDISFCFKARECGFTINVDTTIRVGHIGAYAYSIDDYMSYQQEVLARQPERVRPVEALQEVV